ncbi:MAG: nucleotide exchange factor GrpE [Patescibacteria group bacterium]
MAKEKSKTKDKVSKECKERLSEMEHNWKRALADYQNLEKRVAEDKINLSFISKKIVLVRLLPILDSLEKLEEHIEDKGLKLTLKSFYDALDDLGVKEVDTKDKDFDLNTMEAIELTEGKKNKVLKVHQKGYLLNDKLIRPAKVNVGLGEVKKEEK